METKKMSLATVAGKLSRAEMKNVMAGAVALEVDGDFKCAPNGEACPSPDGPIDGCCGTCKKSASGVKACYPS